MSSVLSTFLAEVPTMTAEQVAETRHAIVGLVAALDARTAALAAAGEKPKRTVTKAKKTAKEAELLAPVDAHAPAPAAPAATPAPDASDPLRAHPSRLQTIDVTKCQGRKIVVSKWVPGTHKDEGGVKKFHPEGQCSSAPVAGAALCAKCQEQEALAAAGKRDAKKWFGRLDQPLYEFAAVVGCKQYMELYPNGIKGDPLSVPPSAAPAALLPVAPGAPKKAKKAKAATDVPTAIAMAELPPVEAEWLTFMNGGKPAIRNLKTALVYSVDDTEERDRAKMAKQENYLGRWDDATNTIDPYFVPDEE